MGKIEHDLTSIREIFHQYPETLWMEFWTSAKICEYMEHLGYDLIVGKDIIQPNLRQMVPKDVEIQDFYHRAIKQGAAKRFLEKMQGGLTGVIGILDTERQGPTFQYEADIDALPIQESENENHIPYKEGWHSKNEGKMHACGHDIHITMALAVAEWISKNKEDLKGKYIFTFTPAEEGGHGALSFSKLPIMEEVDYYFAYHVAGKPLGGMFLVPRVFLRSIESYKVSFKAKKSQAEQALLISLIQEMQQGKLKSQIDFVNAYVERYKQIPLTNENTLKAALSAYSNLQMIPKRMDGQFQFSILNFKQGEYPTYPVSFDFTIRADSNDLTYYLIKKSEKILKNASKTYGVRVKIKRNEEWCYPAWEQNDSGMIALAEKIWNEDHGNTSIKHPFGEMGTDDDVYMMNAIRKNGGKCFYAILTGDTHSGQYGELHTNNFNIDNEIMEAGVHLAIKMIKKILKSLPS